MGSRMRTPGRSVEYFAALAVTRLACARAGLVTLGALAIVAPEAPGTTVAPDIWFSNLHHPVTSGAGGTGAGVRPPSTRADDAAAPAGSSAMSVEKSAAALYLKLSVV